MQRRRGASGPGWRPADHIAHPGVNEVRALLADGRFAAAVDQFLFNGPSYVFAKSPDAEAAFFQHLSRELNVPLEAVRVVGSAKVGFSLDPNAFPRPFSSESDIDVVVVNQEIFDQMWRALLDWNWPRRQQGYASPAGAWLRDRQSDVYWGWFLPDKLAPSRLAVFGTSLRPLRDLAVRWQSAFRGLSKYSQFPQFATREVSGRLYRNWWHAVYYHANGMRALADRLR